MEQIVIDPRLTHFMVCDGGYWAKGETRRQAAEQYEVESGWKPSKKAIWYAVTPETRVNEMGNIAMPRDKFCEPVKLV